MRIRNTVRYSIQANEAIRILVLQFRVTENTIRILLMLITTIIVSASSHPYFLSFFVAYYDYDKSSPN